MSIRRPSFEYFPSVLPPTSAEMVLPRSEIEIPRSVARRRSGMIWSSLPPTG